MFIWQPRHKLRIKRRAIELGNHDSVRSAELTGLRYGQLGDGTTTSSSAPPTSDVLTGVQAIATGDHQTCALMQTGGVPSWETTVMGSWTTSRTEQRPRRWSGRANSGRRPHALLGHRQIIPGLACCDLPRPVIQPHAVIPHIREFVVAAMRFCQDIAAPRRFCALITPEQFCGTRVASRACARFVVVSEFGWVSS